MPRKLLIAVGVISAAVLPLAFVEVESPRLGRTLLQHAEAATGARIEAAGFRLSLLRGLSLREVRATGTMSGGRYEVGLDRLVFAHRLAPLLAGRLSVDRVRLERPRIKLLETGQSAPAARRVAAPSPPAAGIPLALHVAEIAIEDGSIELSAPQRDPVAVRGLVLRLRDLELAPSAKGPLAGLAAVGEIQIDDIALGATHARGVHGTFALDKARFESRDLRFLTDEGAFEASWTASLEKMPFSYAMALHAAPLDLNVISGLAGRGGRFGPADLTLDARGSGPEANALAGRGVLKLEAGTLPATPILAQLEGVLGRTRIVGAPYKATESPYRIADGRVSFERLRLEADTVGLDLGGWTGLDGRIDVKLTVRAPRRHVRIAEVHEDVLDAMTDDAGWVQVPMRITGTRVAPRVLPDAGALAGMARRGGVKALEKTARDRLRGLFGGD